MVAEYQAVFEFCPDEVATRGSDAVDGLNVIGEVCTRKSNAL